jgi:hypothetical protein
MPCIHRFQNDLIPQWQIDYLFVWTFNPAWSRPKGDDAKWFYGRKYNDFWYIMPKVFHDQSLMPKELRENRKILLDYCSDKNIGITDLISSINDANELKQENRDIILSEKDEGFNLFI